MTPQQKFIVHGGFSLNGEITLSGAKNAATKMMIATLLTDEECILENCPHLGDVEITKEICQTVGSQIEHQNNQLKIRTKSISNHRVKELTRKNRISVLTMGPLLHRIGQAELPVVGGDKIGARPVDFHLNALKSMGAEIKITNKGYVAQAKNLQGTSLALPYPSVGATENIILTAVLAQGRTNIINAAIEPEVIDLIGLLQKMGAIIGLGANRQIIINGVKKLSGTTHRILPDRNEAVSFACLALATNGKIYVKEARQIDLITFLNTIRRIGGEYEVDSKGITFYRKNELVGIEVETDTHPGYMTDWQQPLVVTLTQAKGISVVHETVYEDRFGYTEQLNKMGADITIFDKCLGELPCRFNGKGYKHSCIIKGPTSLRGTQLVISDIRAGCAHIIAALTAQGTSVIKGIEHIDRGYQNFEQKIRSLGARVKRV